LQQQEIHNDNQDCKIMKITRVMVVNYWLQQQEDHNDCQDHKIKKTIMMVGNYWL
jgi:hypothetical protein